jgi:hypothetical protein
MPSMRRISVAMWRRPDIDTLAMQLPSQHARAHEGELQVQLVDAAHEIELAGADRPWAGSRPRPRLSSLAWRVMGSAWSRSIMALRSALPPWRALRSEDRSPAQAAPIWHAAVRGPPVEPPDCRSRRHRPRRSGSWRFQSRIWLACTSYSLHSSAIVLSSRKAARATCALNAGLWVRRVRRADFFLTIGNSFSPDPRRPGSTPGVSTYSAVQIRGATSVMTCPVSSDHCYVDFGFV